MNFKFPPSTRILFCLALLMPGFALAGPPFVTDDPEPVDYQHFELNFYTQGTRANTGMSGTVAGLDANYGLYPDVELTLITPLDFNYYNGQATTYGYGDTQLAIKYRFIHESDQNWWPQVAIYPQISIPTGNSSRALGTGKVAEFLPIYLQKDFDPWQIYGGVGYWNNPGIGNKNYWFFGSVLQRQITKNLALGGELFHQTANTIVGHDTSGFNLGGTYDFNENYHLLFSGGRGVAAASDTNQFSYLIPNYFPTARLAL